VCAIQTHIHTTRSALFPQPEIKTDVSAVAKDQRTSVSFDRQEARFVGLDEPTLHTLKKSYPTINVESELEKMVAWLLTSPKAKKRKGNITFILNWLNNASPSPLFKSAEQTQEVNADLPLDPMLDHYLRDLWKGREYLLELNKKKS